MRRSLRCLLVLVLTTLVASRVRAADTGTLSGAIFDPSGTPIGDVVVSASGSHLPGGRTVRSDATGRYQFEYLPPGDYRIEFDKPGAGHVSRAAVVSLGRDTQVDVILGQAVSESLTVAAPAIPLVDTRATEVSFNVNAETINSLPLERAYRGLFQLIPGVADNRSSIGPAAGGSRQDNTYLIDGANIGNPSFGYLGTDVNELDIAEVNLKRAGITAEFGRAGGTVTNAVSRSGSNTFAGVGRVDWLPQGLVSAYVLPDSLLAAGVRPGTFRDALLTTELSPAVGLGGPVLRDRVFFYGSARYFSQTKWERVNKVGTALPDEVRTGHELYGKLSATPSSAHQLSLGYRWRPNSVDNGGLTSDYAPNVGVASDNGSQVATAEWAYFMAPRRSMNVRYTYVGEQNDDRPTRDLGYLPTFNPGNLSAMGQYTDAAQSNLIVGGREFATEQNYRRHDLRGTVTQFANIGATSHAFKAGLGYEFGEESLNRLANGWGAIVNITDSGLPALRARYYATQQPQRGQARTASLFVQDEVTIGNRATVNAGLLATRDLFSQAIAGSHGCPATVTLKGGAAIYESSGDRCDFLRFGFGDELQPRLGLSYPLRPGRGDKAYVNWGRYYNLDQQSSSRSLAPNRIFQTQTIFDLTGRVVSSGPLASTTGKLIDPDIQPIYTDEYLVGYATPFRSLYSLDLFYMARDMKRFIEDLPSRLSGSSQTSGPYVAANLPCTRFAACQNADAKRSYKAVSAVLHRQLANRWMGDVNYTWSRFEGNYDVDYSTTAVVFNTSSFIQDGPGAYVEDPNRFGPLFEDRPHVLKIMGSYAVTGTLMASGYLRVQSGTPWAARGRDAAGAVLNFLEPSGTHRNPTWTNLDLMASYKLPAQGRVGVSLEARVLNVFNNQTQLSTDAQKYLDLRTLSTAPYIDSYLQPNPFFGTANSFSPPRRLYLTAVTSF